MSTTPYPEPLPNVYGAPKAPGTARPAPTYRLEFQELMLRAKRANLGWSLLGVVAVIVLYFIAQVIVVVPIVLVLMLKGESYKHVSDALSGKGHATPSYLAEINLGWALAIVAVWLVVWLVHGLRWSWIESVRPGLRWGWLAWCFGTSLIALLATTAVSAALPGQENNSHYPKDHFGASTVIEFALVILILTPLQAAGEEHVFRGYLMQACGPIFKNRTVTRVVAVFFSGFLFALAHGVGQGLEIFIDRFAFGLGAALLVVLTGGLEAGIAMHVLNNFFAFGLALAGNTMTQSLHASGGSWWGLIGTVVQIGVWLGLTVPLARRRKVQTTADPAPPPGDTGLVPAPGHV